MSPAASAPPISLELALSGRDLTEPRLAPDGSSIAFVQRFGSRSAIMRCDLVREPSSGELKIGREQQATTGVDPAPGRGTGGGAYCWTPTGDLIVAGVDGELWLHDAFGPHRLTALGRSCRAPATDGVHVVCAVDEAEIWRTELATGDHDRIDHDTDAFCFDPDIAPAGIPIAGDVSWLGWSPPDMPWDGARRIVFRSATSTVDRSATAVPGEARWAQQQPRFTPGGTQAWVEDRSGWLNVVVSKGGVVATIHDSAEHAGPTWGMGQRSYAVSPDGTRVAYCRNESGFGALWVVDLESGERTCIGRGVHGGLDWVGDLLCAVRSGARTPTEIVVYTMTDDLSTRPQREVVAVSAAAPWAARASELPEPELVEIPLPPPATTGLSSSSVPKANETLHARRYSAGNGRMLCWVHGGPTDQWLVDWNPRTTYWWSRGWDVLVVDPRGTTGHGRAFQRAMNGGWGRIDVDDTAALIRHAHQQGWASPATTVIVGGSAGGLTALGVLADHGELVAGGVTKYPVSDIAGLAAGTHRFEAHYDDTLVGDPSDVELFRSLSPLTRADQITAPLLLFHGSADPVVPIAQSEALAGLVSGPVEYVVYEGEGHGFRDPVSVRDEYERTAAFLDRLLRNAEAGEQR